MPRNRAAEHSGSHGASGTCLLGENIAKRATEEAERTDFVQTGMWEVWPTERQPRWHATRILTANSISSIGLPERPPPGLLYVYISMTERDSQWIQNRVRFT